MTQGRTDARHQIEIPVVVEVGNGDVMERCGRPARRPDFGKYPLPAFSKMRSAPGKPPTVSTLKTSC